MSEEYKKLEQCFRSVREKISFQPEIGLILGSGLGDYANNIKITETLEYGEIDGFPLSTVAGHKGRFVFGYVDQVPAVIMQGRVHYYEGYPISDVVLPVRLMGMLGIRKLLLTNAAGGVNFDYQPGDFMLIEDHITTFVPSPLIGPNMNEFGERFPDMSDVYNSILRDKIHEVAKKLKIELKEGVYIQLTGPNYETPGEVKMIRALGADATGMSTACEAMAAHHMGILVCGISCITNMACGMTSKQLNHTEVQATADQVAQEFKRLITGIITEIA